MRWADSHLHSFHICDRVFSNSGELEDLNMLQEKGNTLGALLGETIREFAYEYDFGDSWEHRIVEPFPQQSGRVQGHGTRPDFGRKGG